jgi:HPt (histidine-containing phosphotransfer) domain-containing protein
MVEAEKVSEDDKAEIFMNRVDVWKVFQDNMLSMEDYLDLLDIFYTDGKMKVLYLERLIQNEDYDNYRIEVHALKSAAMNIGAEDLSAKAKRQEEAAKKYDVEFIHEEFHDFLTDYRNLLSDIEGVLKKKKHGIFAESRHSHMQKPQPMLEETEVQEKIREALKALEEFRSNEAASGIEELLAHELPDNIREPLVEVKGLIKLYEDDKAEDVLRELLKEEE